MNNNDILRRIRYTLDFNDSKMMELFKSGNHEVNRGELSNWLKKEDDDNFQSLNDLMLAVFLNGLIIEKRGKREGVIPVPEKVLNNNIIFRKLKITFDLKTNDIVEMFGLLDKTISEHEISAFLRNPNKDKYRECNDQYLRNFMSAITKKYKK